MQVALAHLFQLIHRWLVQHHLDEMRLHDPTVRQLMGAVMSMLEALDPLLPPGWQDIQVEEAD